LIGKGNGTGPWAAGVWDIRAGPFTQWIDCIFIAQQFCTLAIYFTATVIP
jgi:hypothetical protein